jgi:hypothetical protein
MFFSKKYDLFRVFHAILEHSAQNNPGARKGIPSSSQAHFGSSQAHFGSPQAHFGSPQAHFSSFLLHE